MPNTVQIFIAKNFKARASKHPLSGAADLTKKNFINNGLTTAEADIRYPKGKKGRHPGLVLACYRRLVAQGPSISKTTDKSSGSKPTAWSLGNLCSLIHLGSCNSCAEPWALAARARQVAGRRQTIQGGGVNGGVTSTVGARLGGAVISARGATLEPINVSRWRRTSASRSILPK